LTPRECFVYCACFPTEAREQHVQQRVGGSRIQGVERGRSSRCSDTRGVDMKRKKGDGDDEFDVFGEQDVEAIGDDELEDDEEFEEDDLDDDEFGDDDDFDEDFVEDDDLQMNDDDFEEYGGGESDR